VLLFQEFLLTLFFSWKSNIAPWTIWSILSFLIIVFGIKYFNIGCVGLIIIWIIVSIISIPVIDNYEKKMKCHDSKNIVIDEFVWVLLTIAIIIYFTNNIYIFFLWLLCFRFFDILKFWLVWYIDREIKWWLWVMLDDILAWIFAGITTVIIYFIFKNIWIFWL